MTGTEASSAEFIDVLLVIDDDVFDRAGSVIRHLCVGMLDEPVRMKVLSRGVQSWESDRIGPAPVVPVGCRWAWRRPTSDDVLDRIGGTRPDIVHCMSGELVRWARPWAEVWGAKLMVHLMDLEDVRHAARIRHLQHVLAIATTGSLERTLLTQRGDFAGRVRTVPVGIPARSEPACLARPERVPAVIVTEPLRRDCGLNVVLEALHTLVKGGEDVQLFILSAGPAEAAFRRQVDKLALRPYVTFAGRMPDWAAFGEAIRGADFHIIPGPRRRFDVNTLAAMAAGLAILAPAGGVEDYLIDGTTARLFRPRDPADLAQKWAALLSDRSAARHLAHLALDYVRTYHQASAMVGAIGAAYRQLYGLPVAVAPP